MKRVVTKLIAVCIMATLVVSPVVASASATTNMTKVLSYYHKKNYKKAGQYNKRLPRYANESCVKKIPSKMKKAYRNAVDQVFALGDASSMTGESFMWDFYLTDINNDKKADLLITFGTCEADVQYFVFQYRNNKVVKTGEGYCAHSLFCAYPNHTGIVRMEGHMGCEAIYEVTQKRNGISEKTIGSRNAPKDYFPLREELKGHIKYDKNSNRYIDYRELK